jgi:hypothetical protein
VLEALHMAKGQLRARKKINDLKDVLWLDVLMAAMATYRYKELPRLDM